MIKVFTTDRSPDIAGNHLTSEIEKWMEKSEEQGNKIFIDHIHTNSNKFGWMIVLQYNTVKVTVKTTRITMAQTKKQEEEVKQAMLQPPPKNYGKDVYLFNITGCPGYKGYIPENLSHEVCRYCGSIEYYH